MNVLDVNKPKQRPAAKKRGFFNRTRTNIIHRNTNNNINTIGNAFASAASASPAPISHINHIPKQQSPTIIAGFDMSEANEPKPRKSAPKSFIRINNNLIPKHNNTNTLSNGIRDRKRPHHQLVIYQDNHKNHHLLRNYYLEKLMYQLLLIIING